MNDRVERITTMLQDLSPISCQVEDESALHAGHAGAASGGGHYRLHLVSNRFEGLNRVSRHRLVYDCLGKLMKTEIHALALTLLTPAEANQEVD
jgi:BolA protein